MSFHEKRPPLHVEREKSKGSNTTPGAQQAGLDGKTAEKVDTVVFHSHVTGSGGGQRGTCV